jgi:hypothetical protein
MRSAAARRPRRVRLIDWSARAYGHDSWFHNDGTHLRRSGVRVYSRMLKVAVWARQRARFGTAR